MRTATILHAALAMSVVMYGAALWMIVRVGKGMALDLSIFLPATAVPALMLAVVAAVVRKRNLAPRREPAGLEEEGEPRMEDEAARAAAARWHTTNIISWALCEAVAIDGFVLAFLTHDLRIYCGFAVAALALMGLWRPREVDLREMVLGAR